jgi:hypothetical protein
MWQRGFGSPTDRPQTSTAYRERARRRPFTALCESFRKTRYGFPSAQAEDKSSRRLLQDMDSFQFVEINGMKIAEPNTAFSLLWEALSGQKCAPRQALTQLESHFQTPDPARKTT